MRRSIVSLFIAAAFVVAAAAPTLAAQSAASGLRVRASAQVASDTTAGISLRLPAGVAAVDGRVFLDTSAAEVVGVSATNGGVALAPEQFAGGYAFGVYGMHASKPADVVISVATSADGRLPFRVVIDAVGDANGNPVQIGSATAAGTIHFGSAARQFAAVPLAARRVSAQPGGPTRDLVPDGRLAVTDLDVVSAAWATKHVNDDPCTGDNFGADANGDGCVDILDVQSVLAHQSWTVANGVALAPTGQADGNQRQGTLAVASGLIFVVTSTADADDAHPGDGVCADSQSRCTLRAAITESNWDKGNNTINFNLPGSAPVAIQLSTSLPQFVLQDRTGGTLIDGYSQPGSRANTATYGSNAIPGVYLVGTGNSPSQNGFRITSAYNTVRGIVFNKFDRTFVMDGTDAHDNLVAGDWLNYNRDGSPSTFKGHYNVWISNGANHNHLGSPLLADRNVSGNAVKGAALYGPGTDYNVIQNNDFCMTPSGTAVATCDVGTDYTFGPKHNLIGGTDPGDGNVYGASTQQCIEFAHDNGIDDTDQWKNEDNSIIGNWLGFRADGSYASAFRCGSNAPSNGSNDSNGINMADGSPGNLVQGNWIASWYDGVNIMIANERDNVVRGNVIGESPQGQAAPLGRYGINLRTHAHYDQIIGNTIRNAGTYGIAIMGSDETNILMSQNIITDMSGQAIHLEPNANWHILPPTITTATTASVTGKAESGTTVEVYKASRNAGLVGLPIAYLGSAVTASNGTWTASVAGLVTGDKVTALQIRPDGNTSGLAINVSATKGQAPPAPVANFSSSQTTGLTVAFQDTSTGTIATWSWNFGDGSTSTARNPSHTYAAAGTFTVVLTVANAGGSSSKTRQVTVQSAPPPPPPGTIAADAFGRSTASGWGSADTGGAYTVQGTATDYSVAGGAGLMQVTSGGSTRYALLPATSGQNVELLFRVAVNKVAAGGNYIVYAVARRNSTNEYRARLTFKSDGTVAVDASVVLANTETVLGTAQTVSGLTQSSGQYIWVRARVTGTNPTTIQVKAWADGSTEPSAWQYTVTDTSAAVQTAGSVGLRVWVAAKATTAPITFSFDDYSVGAV